MTWHREMDEEKKKKQKKKKKKGESREHVNQENRDE
jgi:hypothetical protein